MISNQEAHIFFFIISRIYTTRNEFQMSLICQTFSDTVIKKKNPSQTKIRWDRVYHVTLSRRVPKAPLHSLAAECVNSDSDR